MPPSTWDAALGRCVDVPAALPEQCIALPIYDPEMAASGYQAADAYLDALRRAPATSQVHQFNLLMANRDYRKRFFDAYPEGRNDGVVAALDEILTEINDVLQALYLAAEAIADDPSLIGDIVGATAAMYTRNMRKLSDDDAKKLDDRVEQVRKRLITGIGYQPDVGAMPFPGVRQSTRQMLQALSALRLWQGLMSGPSKMALATTAIDAVFQAGQDWSDVLVGAEDDFSTLFATTTEALMQLNCDPAAQGYNLGWITGYSALWVATIVVYEISFVADSPL